MDSLTLFWNNTTTHIMDKDSGCSDRKFPPRYIGACIAHSIIIMLRINRTLESKVNTSHSFIFCNVNHQVVRDDSKILRIDFDKKIEVTRVFLILFHFFVQSDQRLSSHSCTLFQEETKKSRFDIEFSIQVTPLGVTYATKRKRCLIGIQASSVSTTNSFVESFPIDKYICSVYS
jgi:hypothetical protein